MKVLITDSLPAPSINRLRQAGHDVTVASLSGEALKQTLGTLLADVLVVRSTKVDKEALRASPSLGLVVRAGAGYDNIDVAAASEYGIFVANCPGKNGHAVAELAIGLMVAMDRRIPDVVQASREGWWDKARYAQADGLCQRTLGVIGMGAIGRQVAQAGLGLSMHVVAWSRSLTQQMANALGVARAPTPEDVAAVSDVVSLHIAATDDTHHLAGREFFQLMKPGAIFINTSRGSLVDEEALQWGVQNKGIRAALDVFENEPRTKQGPFTFSLAGDENVYVTHHIGASTLQAQTATADEVVRIICTFAEKGFVPNCVNIKMQSIATHLLTVRHLDRIGVLASTLDIVRGANLNVQEMENLVFAGSGSAACARIRISGDPDDGLVQQIEKQDYVLAASLVRL